MKKKRKKKLDPKEMNELLAETAALAKEIDDAVAESQERVAQARSSLADMRDILSSVEV